MMFARISEDHVAFSSKDSAPRILVVLGLLQRGRTAIQACHDIAYKNYTNKTERKEVSLEIHELASTLQEQSHTWNKSCENSAKREGDLL